MVAKKYLGGDDGEEEVDLTCDEEAVTPPPQTFGCGPLCHDHATGLQLEADAARRKAGRLG